MQILNLRLTRDNLSRPWGFRLQGGFDSGTALSVQRVFSGSPAEGILQRGDIVQHIENCDVSTVSNKEVQDIIRSSGRQLNFIIERDANRPESYTEDSVGNDDSERSTNEKVSVQAARKKFMNSENRAPLPFGQFGTQYEKKNFHRPIDQENSIPTGVKLEMENSFHQDEFLTPRNQSIADDQEENVDYSFMTLPVSERKKLYGKHDESLLGSRTPNTGPRQRSFSYRPNRGQGHHLRNQPDRRAPVPQFGWGPGKEQTLTARNLSANMSARSPNQQRRFFSNTEPNKGGRVTSSATIPRVRQAPSQSTSSFYDYNSPVTKPLVTGSYHQVFRVQGTHNDRNRSVEPIFRSQPPPTTIMQQSQVGNLYVKTYTDYPTSPMSTRNFKPAYPAYTARQGGDYMETHEYHRPLDSLSIRSEPYSRQSGYETLPIMRHEREVTPMVNSNTLTMGPPRTRVVASPASPSYYLNKSPDHQPSSWKPSPWLQSRQHQPTVTKVVLNRNQSMAPNQFSKPQSSVTIHQNNKQTVSRNIRPVQYTQSSEVDDHDEKDLIEQVKWMSKHRHSLAACTDF